MSELDIAEVSQASGLAASTLRYYEELGLIRSSGRKGLRRQYGPEVLEHLNLIALGQSAGFSLNEILEMFTPNGPVIKRQKLLQKAEQLDQKIKKLTAMQKGLRHAAVCPAASHFDCPKFQTLLDQANRNPAQRETKAK